jgi:hypothetical protein
LWIQYREVSIPGGSETQAKTLPAASGGVFMPVNLLRRCDRVAETEVGITCVAGLLAQVLFAIHCGLARWVRGKRSPILSFEALLVGGLASSVTLSRSTSVIGKAREGRTSLQDLSVRIFISYSSAYRDTAESIAIRLRQDGHAVFFDRHSLQAAEEFDAGIRREIENADLFLFLIAPEAVPLRAYPAGDAETDTNRRSAALRPGRNHSAGTG